MALVGMSSDGQRWSRTSVDETSDRACTLTPVSPRRHSSAVNGLSNVEASIKPCPHYSRRIRRLYQSGSVDRA